MVMKTVLCLATLIALGSAGYCPTYTCDTSLASNVCAASAGGQAFKLNSNGCQSGYFCSAVATNLWSVLLSGTGTATGATLSCTAETTSTTTTTTTFTSYSCGAKVTGKTFKSGQSVVSCNSDSDCVQTDGTNADCMCIFKTDSSGICEAHRSNDVVFSGFWSDCGTSNTITDEDTAAYWDFYISYWEYTNSNVSCMSIFMETTLLNDLYDAYNGAATLAVGVFGLLALY